MTLTATRPPDSELAHKELGGDAAKVLSTEEELDAGIVKAVVAVTGNKDDGGDIIEPGELDLDRWPVIVWAHNLKDLVARVDEVEEWEPGDERLNTDETKDLYDAGFGAIVFTMAFDLEDPDSFRVFRKVKHHKRLGWSIGYSAQATQKSDGRHLSKLTIWEASPLAFGMNREARTVSVKTAQQKARFKGAFDAVLSGLDEEKANAVQEVLAVLADRGETIEDLVAEDAGEDGTKAWPPLEGSWEALREALEQAASDWALAELGERTEESWWYAFVEATFDDDFIFTISHRTSDYNRTSYRAAYTVAADGTAEITGEVEEVEIVTTSVVKGDASVTQRKVKEPETPAPDAPLTDAEKAFLVEHLGEEKAGRVLSSRNATRIRNALNAITEVLADADPEDDDKDEKGGTKPEEHKAGAVPMPADLMLEHLHRS